MSQPRPLLQQVTEFARDNNITLPVFHDTAQKLLAAARTGEYRQDEIIEAIEGEQALAAEVLRTANSAFYFGLGEARTIKAAITRLGIVQVANIVVMATERDRYRARHPFLGNMMVQLWQHASSTAIAAGWIAGRLRYPHLAEEVFIGGLVHDVGKLLQVRVLDEMLAARAIDTGQLAPELVREVLAQGHTQIGHELLTSWHLPDVYCAIVRDHHRQSDRHSLPMLMIRLANDVCHKVGLGYVHDPSIELDGSPDAIALGISDVVLAELEVMMENRLEAAA